jgi:hypothetical protein
MENLTGLIGNNRWAVLGAERLALLLLKAISVEKNLGTPMNAHEIEESIRDAVNTLREHHDSLFPEAR